MKGRSGNRAILLVLLLLTILAGFLGFRYFYGISGSFPFAQELLLVFIGAIATVLITALLLNQQTEQELRKEGQVLLLTQKASTYEGLIDHLGRIVEQRQMGPAALAELRVLNHKLAMVGSVSVIRHFNDVLDQLDNAVRDNSIATPEQDQIMRSVAVLTYYMRCDLLGQVGQNTDQEVLADIIANNADLETEASTQESKRPQV